MRPDTGVPALLGTGLRGDMAAGPVRRCGIALAQGLRLVPRYRRGRHHLGQGLHQQRRRGFGKKRVVCRRVRGAYARIVRFWRTSSAWNATTPWRNPWFALDQIGMVLQLFAKARDGDDRIPLGLPRRVGRGRDTQELHAGNVKRHASPAIWSLGARDGGALTIRLAAFPAPRLPDPKASKAVLCELAGFAKDELTKQTKQQSRAANSRLLPTGHLAAPQLPLQHPRRGLRKGSASMPSCLRSAPKKEDGVHGTSRPIRICRSRTPAMSPQSTGRATG